MVRDCSPQVEGACVFCDKKNFGERLIAETPSLYYVATLGQITDGGYTLVIPKRHVSCLGAMEESELAGVEGAMRDAAEAIDAEYGVKPVIFEHGIVGQTVPHAHLHLMPAEIRLDERVTKDFPQAELTVMSSFGLISRLYRGTEKKYLLWNVPARPWLQNDGMTLFEAVWDPPAPPQYLRIVAAELTGKPDRANGRTMAPELDKKLWSETVARLAPYLR